MESVESIHNFYTKSSRGDNHATNITRENILYMILSNKVPIDYFSHEIYGEKWMEIKTKLLDCLSTNNICLEGEVEKKGGMKHNYDIQITGKEIVKIEFKSNNDKVNKLPQFLELYDKNVMETYHMVTMSYSEFYYTNYLDEYLKEDAFSVAKPSLAEYIECVKNYNHPFIKELYDKKENNNKKKRTIVNRSMKDYITTYGPSFSFEKIEEKIRESQKGKVYLFWNGDFHIQELDVSKIKIVGIIKFKNLCLDVQVDGFDYNLCIRLNWGNNNGVSNPRWKFTWI